MTLRGFAGRTVPQVERDNGSLRITFKDGGDLYVRARGPEGSRLKISCLRTHCQPTDCSECREVESAASE